MVLGFLVVFPVDPLYKLGRKTMSFCAKVESRVWRMYLCNPLQESGFCFELLSVRYWARKQAP